MGVWGNNKLDWKEEVDKNKEIEKVDKIRNVKDGGDERVWKVKERRKCSRENLNWRNDVRKDVKIEGKRKEREEGNNRGSEEINENVIYYISKKGYYVKKRNGKERSISGEMNWWGNWINNNGDSRKMEDRNGERNGDKWVFRIKGSRRNGFLMEEGVRRGIYLRCYINDNESKRSEKMDGGWN